MQAVTENTIVRFWSSIAHTSIGHLLVHGIHSSISVAKFAAGIPCDSPLGVTPRISRSALQGLVTPVIKNLESKNLAEVGPAAAEWEHPMDHRQGTPTSPCRYINTSNGRSDDSNSAYLWDFL